MRFNVTGGVLSLSDSFVYQSSDQRAASLNPQGHQSWLSGSQRCLSAIAIFTFTWLHRQKTLLLKWSNNPATKTALPSPFSFSFFSNSVNRWGKFWRMECKRLEYFLPWWELELGFGKFRKYNHGSSWRYFSRNAAMMAEMITTAFLWKEITFFKKFKFNNDSYQYSWRFHGFPIFNFLDGSYFFNLVIEFRLPRL